MDAGRYAVLGTEFARTPSSTADTNLEGAFIEDAPIITPILDSEVNRIELS